MSIEEIKALALFEYAMATFKDEFENLLREWAGESDEWVHRDDVAQAYQDSR